MAKPTGNVKRHQLYIHGDVGLSHKVLRCPESPMLRHSVPGGHRVGTLLGPPCRPTM